MIYNLFRIIRTIKYLKLSQLYWRLLYKFPKKFKKFHFYPSVTEKLDKNIFICKNYITDDYKDFIFLNEIYDLNIVGWDNPSISKLWRYNLHYFDFLLQESRNSQFLNKQILFINNRIDNNKNINSTAWEPYPTSIRIINWIKWNLITDCLSNNAKLNLWNQVNYLSKNIEFHILGNHLFTNAKALLFASYFFQLKQDSIILKKALNIINNELDEQFLRDGAHFELSPMYHSIAMEDLLDLYFITKNLQLFDLSIKIKNKFLLGMNWLYTMKYENLELSNFNDSTNNIAPNFNELINYSNNLGISLINFDKNFLKHHVNSGFFVTKNHDLHLIADIGKVGPDYLPAHAHADTLSFELAIKEHRVIVNSGISEYALSKERIYQRSTKAHSTVEIDSENSSEIWSSFRVGRRAFPFDIKFLHNKDLDNFISVSACHNGYRFLKNSPIHKRQWVINSKTLIITDEVSGMKNKVIIRYYFHPDIIIVNSNNGYIIKKDNFNLARFFLPKEIVFQLINTKYHDQFGVSKNNKCLEIKLTSPFTFKFKLDII